MTQPGTSLVSILERRRGRNSADQPERTPETRANGIEIASDSPLFRCLAAKTLQGPPHPLFYAFSVLYSETPKPLLVCRFRGYWMAVGGLPGAKRHRSATVSVQGVAAACYRLSHERCDKRTTPVFTLGEAARQAGVSKPTLSKA
jgi:hypothetical protein